MNEINQHQVYQQYGYAFAQINLVEMLLELVLCRKGGLDRANLTLRNKLLQNTTLERKRNLSKDLINNKNLDKKLEMLISKRQKLAHAHLAQAKNTGEWFFIGGNKGAEKIDDIFFINTIELANDIIQELIPLSTSD